MTEASVTVVVATYGRPDALTCALESVRRQTVQDWSVLVVGDCDPLAGDVVAALGDPRVRFVNLPSRQGEQGPPNSVGIALAATPLIALLNHDDLWLPDHLERAAAAIDQRNLDVYAGSAAFAHHVAAVPGGTRRPVFTERTPKERRLSDVFVMQPFAFEPASALVFTRDLARRVGPWRPSALLFRTPLHDWLLRMWRISATFFSDPRITTVKVNTHNKQGTTQRYAYGADDQALLLGMLDTVGEEGFRAVIRSDLRVAPSWGVPRGRNAADPFPRAPDPEWTARLLDPDAAQRFLHTGQDVFDEIMRERGLSPGGVLSQALQRRTGETLGEPGDLETLITHCRRQLETG